MHHIQRDILKHLIKSNGLRFSQLKPDGMESNLFMYHLKALIREGIVAKDSHGQYILTKDGLKYINRLNLAKLSVTVQPKVITILVIENSNKDIAILERLHQPYLNHKGFPSGKVHYGESIHVAAQRELEEKTGLKDVGLHLRGNIIMRLVDNNSVTNHIIGYVFYGKCMQEVGLDYKTEYFMSSWQNRKVLLKDNRFKAHPEIMELIERTPAEKFFFEEFEFYT